jgi:hypothetical protein
MRTLATITVFAALLAGSQVAIAQQKAGTDKPFCIQGATTSKAAGEEECRFDTMAQCEAAAKGVSTAKCGPNPKMAAPAKK